MYQYDINFLTELSENYNREVYAKITSLSLDEKPIEMLQGRITGGSISIDGKSALRRTCQISMTAQDIKLREYLWGLKTKFKLELGLKNTINTKYPDIIWFKFGIYVITNFSYTSNTSSTTINISGKDKMCLLNGELGGNLPHTTDFGVEETYTEEGDTIYRAIPIYEIIYNSLIQLANERPENIIINDLEEAGLELLEYRGDIPMFLFREINSSIFTNMTINGNQRCYINGVATNISDSTIIYDNLVDLEDTGNDPTIIQLSNEEGALSYTVAKIEYGNVSGYRLTDLTYPGDLIGNVGEALTTIYDKIVKALVNYEYFYDLDGRFVFQKKSEYFRLPWNHENEESQIINLYETPIYNFMGSQIVSSYSNTPQFSNIKNDFSVWGQRKFTSEKELPIHARFAIDKKPTSYTTLRFEDNKEYTDSEYDWREIIYQMAKDYRALSNKEDFRELLEQANPQYLDGITKYEQYYIDMEGFWRELYNPFQREEDFKRGIYETYKQEDYDPVRYWNYNVSNNPENLLFWFDFFEAYLVNYATYVIGDRTKVVNSNDINAIYYREVPNVLFRSINDTVYEQQTGYVYIQLQPYMLNLFTVSKTRKSTWDEINNLLYTHSSAQESVTIQGLPVYFLDVGKVVMIKDEQSGMDDKYIIDKITIPLTYNGTMSLTASKVMQDIL